jgi:HK97 gp10 family phage protein
MPGPTLKDIANQFQNLAKLAISRQPNRAIKTGTLRDSIRVIQTRTNKAGGAIFDLKTVYYGFFVENGTRKMRPRPFAAEAANSDVLKSMIDDYMKSQVELTLMETMKATDKRLKKYVK